MALSDADTARLEALRTARDRLLKGEQVARVTTQGRSVEFAASSLSDIRDEIYGLEAKDAGGKTRGAIRFRFR